MRLSHFIGICLFAILSTLFLFAIKTTINPQKKRTELEIRADGRKLVEFADMLMAVHGLINGKTVQDYRHAISAVNYVRIQYSGEVANVMDDLYDGLSANFDDVDWGKAHERLLWLANWLSEENSKQHDRILSHKWL
ncbi:MAG: hypothetical protein [Caudoviricetes sp.]|nr:MAG: hypothetical protein [Caudoviricetes sp.]